MREVWEGAMLEERGDLIEVNGSKEGIFRSDVRNPFVLGKHV